MCNGFPQDLPNPAFVSGKKIGESLPGDTLNAEIELVGIQAFINIHRNNIKK